LIQDDDNLLAYDQKGCMSLLITDKKNVKETV